MVRFNKTFADGAIALFEIEVTGLAAEPMEFFGLLGRGGTATFCPLSDNSGQRWILACGGLSAFDPKRTLAVHCSNGLDAGFSLYRTTCLSR